MGIIPVQKHFRCRECGALCTLDIWSWSSPICPQCDGEVDEILNNNQYEAEIASERVTKWIAIRDKYIRGELQ